MKPYYSDSSVTLYNCDCRELIGSIDGDVVITDPPYGETALQWDNWQEGWMDLLRPDSMWCFGSLRMFMEHATEFGGWRLAQDVIWKKHNGSSFMADRFRRIHEHAVQFYRSKWADVFKETQYTMDATARTVRKKGRPTHTGNIGSKPYESIDGGPRMMTSVIEARSCHGNAIHETQKPLKIIGPLIEYSCPAGGTVIDAFAGSCSTLVAAKELGRKAIGFEVREDCCESAASRLSQQYLSLA